MKNKRDYGPLIVLSICYVLNQLIYAGVVNNWYFVFITFFIVVASKGMKEKLDIGYRSMLVLIVVQVGLMAMFFPQGTYKEAESKIVQRFKITRIDNQKPMNIRTSTSIFTMIDKGYVFELTVNGEKRRIVVNPENLELYRMGE